MQRIEVMSHLNYASDHGDPRDLFITVEMTDDKFLKEEEKIIDNLMDDFYKKYANQMKKIIDKAK